MKKFLPFIAASFLISSASIIAEIDETDWSLEKVTPPTNQGPFSLSANYDTTGNSKFKKNIFDDQHIRYDIGNITGSAVLYYDAKYKEGALISLGYTSARINWSHNPFFDQKHFQTLNVSIGGFTSRLGDWTWTTLITANIDTTEWNNLYTNYDITLWGQYAYCKDINLHFGFIAQTGMKMDRVYPILGFDWKINTDWKLSFVFPINMSINYLITKELSVGLAARPFDYRNRVNRKEELSRAVFRYQSMGGELGVNYDNDTNITANVHAGYILGGHLRIASQHNRHPKRLKFGSAPYVGAEAAFRF